MTMTNGMTGEGEILRKLKKLSNRSGLNAMRRALRKGANLVRDVARQNAKRIDDPVSAADISKNIAVQAGGKRRERQYGGAVMRVGVRGGARFRKGGAEGLSGGNTTHWRYLEFGTSQTRAQPFMRPAAASSAGQAAEVVGASALQELDKEISKL
jgi:HK97 gp10 family phage protein